MASEDDRIELRGIRALGVHGVLPVEREGPQPFEVDVDVWLDTAAAARSDDLADTVDYAEVAARAAAVVGGPSFALLEALAAAMARELLSIDLRIHAVGVTVRKLRPPVPLDLSSVGVRVVLART